LLTKQKKDVSVRIVDINFCGFCKSDHWVFLIDECLTPTLAQHFKVAFTKKNNQNNQK
jgi:alkylhydroperoxidase family enzyme